MKHGTRTSADPETNRSRILDRYASVSALDRPLESKRLTLAHNLAPHLRTLERGAPVLDIGSGQGETLMVCRDHGLAAEGVDVSSELAEACRSRGLKVTLIESLVDYLRGCTNQWALVTMIDVLEHFKKEEAVEILQLVRAHALRPGGRVVIQVPNMQSLFAANNRYRDFTHEVGYTETSILQLLDVAELSNARGFRRTTPVKACTWRVARFASSCTSRSAPCW